MRLLRHKFWDLFVISKKEIAALIRDPGMVDSELAREVSCQGGYGGDDGGRSGESGGGSTIGAVSSVARGPRKKRPTEFVEFVDSNFKHLLFLSILMTQVHALFAAGGLALAISGNFLQCELPLVWQAYFDTTRHPTRLILDNRAKFMFAFML